MTSTIYSPPENTDAKLEAGLESQDKGNEIFYASKKRLMWLRFKQHKVALFSAIMIIFAYIVAIFAHFVSVQDINTFSAKYSYVAPTEIHWVDKEGNFTRPYIHNITRKINMDTLEYEYTAGEDVYPIKFLHRGYKYTFLGLIETDLHLIGVDEGSDLVPNGLR
ncbi:hypothetical protein ACLKMH_00930 [Psychromonas sp. KJ10-10]|uniref:hypothetical protein n=1 Tax=Psychromonas sp. KJ10-10 TaxID=3391823 RepID=UPI0039B6E15D